MATRSCPVCSTIMTLEFDENGEAIFNCPNYDCSRVLQSAEHSTEVTDVYPDPPKNRIGIWGIICGLLVLCVVGFVSVMLSIPSKIKQVAQATESSEETPPMPLPQPPQPQPQPPPQPPQPPQPIDTPKPAKNDFTFPSVPQVLSGDKIAERLRKSVVWIVATDGKSSWGGSGTLVDGKEKFVLTNEHVANPRCIWINVLFPQKDKDGNLITEHQHYSNLVDNKKGIKATLIAADRVRDLALIRLETVPKEALVLPISAKPAKQGQLLHTIGGHPRGSDSQWIYSSGTVRQISFVQWHYADGFPRAAKTIESTVPINSGDSGGAAVDNRVVLVGVNNATTGGSLNSKHIDVTEVHDFLRKTYKSIGKTWKEPVDDPRLVEDRIAPADLAKLLKALESADADIRHNAVLVLAAYGPRAHQALANLLDTLRKNHDDKLLFAIRNALGEIGEPGKEYLRQLRGILTDTKASVEARIYAAGALGKLGTDAEDAVGDLAKVVQSDAKADLRVIAARAIGQIGIKGRESAFQALFDTLGDTVAAVRQAALEGLQALGKPADETADVLRSALKSSRSTREKRHYAVWGLCRLGEANIPTVCNVVRNDSDSEIQAIAVYNLGLLRSTNKEIASTLEKAQKHPNFIVRLAVAHAIVEIGIANSNTMELMLKILQDNDQRVIQAATPGLRVFTHYGNSVIALRWEQTWSKELFFLLKAENPQVRAFAAFGAGQLGSPTLKELDAIREALRKEKHHAPRLEFLGVLTTWGAVARNAASEVKGVLTDVDAVGMVKTAAGLALASMRNDKDMRQAYHHLARALYLRNHQTPDPLERVLHGMAQKALARGGFLAGVEISGAAFGVFKGTIGDSEEVLKDKINARLVACKVLREIGPPAQCAGVLKFLTLTIRSERLKGVEDPAVITAAKAAYARIYGRSP